MPVPMAGQKPTLSHFRGDSLTHSPGAVVSSEGSLDDSQ